MLDLHMHTTWSDGEDNEVQILDKIIDKNIKYFAITDHDTIDGVKAMLVKDNLLKMKANHINYYTGVEFSCTVDGNKVHILGFSFDPHHDSINATVQKCSDLRFNRFQMRLAHLKNNFNIILPESAITWLTSLRTIGKPHIAKCLIEEGHANSINEAVQKYLKLPESDDRIQASEAIKALHNSGGVAVWAHPYGEFGSTPLTDEQVERTIINLKEYEIDGIECYYSAYDTYKINTLIALANKYNLLISAGSDFHGEHSSRPNLGKTNLNTDIDYLTVLNKLTPINL